MSNQNNQNNQNQNRNQQNQQNQQNRQNQNDQGQNRQNQNQNRYRTDFRLNAPGESSGAVFCAFSRQKRLCKNKAAFNICAEAAYGIHACSAAVVSRNSSEMHHAADSATSI